MGVPTLLVNDTAPEQHHGCARVMRTLRILCAAHELDVIGSSPVHASWREQDEFTKLLRRARLIIVNGEGSIHHGGKQAEEILSIGRVARDFNIPAVLLNLSWEANPPHFVGLASSFALIAARETKSQSELVRHGVQACCAPDLSLYLPYRGDTRLSRAGALFTDSVVPATAAALARQRSVLGGREISIFEASLHNDIIWKTRMAVARARSTPTAGRLMAFAANWPSAPAASDDLELLRTIAAARVLVTGRFHAACFALLAETPMLAIESNTHKIGALIKDAGLEPWRIVREPQSIDHSALDRAAPFARHEQQSIRDYLESGRMAVRRIFSEIRRLC